MSKVHVTTLRDVVSSGTSPEHVDAAVRDAYQKVFTGQGGASEASVVLGDLLRQSGYYAITPPVSPEGEPRTSEALWYSEGMRAMVARILWMVDVDVGELRRAAAQDATA